jgi:transposase
MNTYETFKREDLEKLDRDALIEAFLKMQDTLVGRLEARDAQQAKTSRNSSKPPSSDGPKGQRKRRKKSDKPSGGQPGHEGHHLEMVAEPHQVVTHSPDTCAACQASLDPSAGAVVGRRQVFDVPPQALEVTEHRILEQCCAACGHVNQGAYPTEVKAPTQYGPRLQAQIVYLSAYQHLPVARIGELLDDYYGVRPSDGFITTTLQRAHKAVEPSVAAIRDQLQQADVVHVDETGLNVAGKTHWLHVMSTSKLTAYAVHARRGKTALDEIGFLGTYTGRIMHDFWQSYLKFDNCQHAFCNAHLLRELAFVADYHQQAWADDMITLLCDIKAAVETTTADQLPTAQREAFVTRYYGLLAQSLRANPPPEPTPNRRGRRKKSRPRNLLERFHHYMSDILAFMYDFRVPFDNNQAERDLRMMKLKQKISGCFRALTGAEAFVALRSYLSTARKQGHNMLHVLYDALTGIPFVPALPE